MSFLQAISVQDPQPVLDPHAALQLVFPECATHDHTRQDLFSKVTHKMPLILGERGLEEQVFLGFLWD